MGVHAAHTSVSLVLAPILGILANLSMGPMHVHSMGTVSKFLSILQKGLQAVKVPADSDSLASEAAPKVAANVDFPAADLYLAVELDYASLDVTTKFFIFKFISIWFFHCLMVVH
jgi:hypothetical protein